MTEETTAPAVTKIADLATALDEARSKHTEAKIKADFARTVESDAAAAEKAAYKAFNEAVIAMKPKRKAKTAKVEKAEKLPKKK